jgi:hypothetical protein
LKHLEENPAEKLQEPIIPPDEIAFLVSQVADLFTELGLSPIQQIHIASTFAKGMLEAVTSNEVGIFCDCQFCKKKLN